MHIVPHVIITFRSRRAHIQTRRSRSLCSQNRRRLNPPRAIILHRILKTRRIKRNPISPTNIASRSKGDFKSSRLLAPIVDREPVSVVNELPGKLVAGAGAGEGAVVGFDADRRDVGGNLDGTREGWSESGEREVVRPSKTLMKRAIFASN